MKYLFTIFILALTSCGDNEPQLVFPVETYSENGIWAYEFEPKLDSKFIVIDCRVLAASGNNFAITTDMDRMFDFLSENEYIIPDSSSVVVFYKDNEHSFYELRQNEFSLTEFTSHIRNHGADEITIQGYMESRSEGF